MVKKMTNESDTYGNGRSNIPCIGTKTSRLIRIILYIVKSAWMAFMVLDAHMKYTIIAKTIPQKPTFRSKPPIKV